jgi:hypothetical protein
MYTNLDLYRMGHPVDGEGWAYGLFTNRKYGKWVYDVICVKFTYMECLMYFGMEKTWIDRLIDKFDLDIDLDSN